MIRLALAAALLLGGATATAAQTYDEAFVAAFAEACVPGRLSFAATRRAAADAGWMPAEADAHPELETILAVGAAQMEDPELEMTAETAIFARDLAGTPHHLVVTEVGAVIDPDMPPWVLIGCHIYNFDATAPLDPAAVTALIENPISRTQEQDGVVSHVWGPPCPMPRTGDTYLNFVAESSPWAAEYGFSGIALNFSTSEPDPGEEVPDTYC